MDPDLPGLILCLNLELFHHNLCARSLISSRYHGECCQGDSEVPSPLLSEYLHCHHCMSLRHTSIPNWVFLGHRRNIPSQQYLISAQTGKALCAVPAPLFQDCHPQVPPCCGVISSLHLPGCSQSADRLAYWLSEIQFVGVVRPGVFAAANGLI